MLLHCLTTRGTSDLKIQRHIYLIKTTVILDSNQKSAFNNKKGHLCILKEHICCLLKRFIEVKLNAAYIVETKTKITLKDKRKTKIVPDY